MKKPHRGLAITNWLMAALFAVAAALQLNDPDPLVWVGIYAAAVAACLSFARSRSSRWVIGGVGLVALIWGGRLAISVASDVGALELFEPMETKGGRVETGREAVGLIIVGVWMSVLLVAELRRPRQASRKAS